MDLENWRPQLNERVLLRLDGEEIYRKGTITWHGMIDSDWGGFSVTLDEKPLRFTKTVGPYRADHFKNNAIPQSIQ